MLVLSRKQNETIVFPNLGIAVEVLRIAGKSVSVGVRAPENLRILRGELADKRPDGAVAGPTGIDTHTLRNKLNQASLALHLAKKQWRAGRTDEAENSLSQALASLNALEKMAAADCSGLAQHSAAALSSAAPSPANGKRRALLVEDDANERELLAAYLRLSGYQVETVQDGLEAIEFLEQQQQVPDVVVMDMQMPRMNGRRTVNAIRSNPKWSDIRLIVVSGTKQSEMNVPVGDRGVNGWFEKPLKPDDLVSHLSSLN